MIKGEGREKHLSRKGQETGCLAKGERDSRHFWNDGLVFLNIPWPLLVWVGIFPEGVPHWWSLNQSGNGWAVLVPHTWRCGQDLSSLGWSCNDLFLKCLIKDFIRDASLCVSLELRFAPRIVLLHLIL